MKIVVRAPGRICLFGDHQDYLELPIIACAINRYVTISGVPNDVGYFKITMPDLGERYKMRFRENVFTPHTRHLIHALSVLKHYGCVPNKGYDIEIISNLPINAGLSSSSAVVVAWVRWLLEAFGGDLEITPKLIGQIAYEAEVLETGGSGGKMDQYTSAIGNTIYLETDSKSAFEKFSNDIPGVIIAQSGIPKDTEGVLGDLKGNQLRALNKAKSVEPHFDKYVATVEDYERLKGHFSATAQSFLYAAIVNHQITKKALEHFRESEEPKTSLNLKYIGSLMNEHHTVLQQQLGITVARIDTMINAAINAGAYGAKIVGSGGGGSVCAIAPEGKEEIIINAILKAGATAASQVDLSNGVTII